MAFTPVPWAKVFGGRAAFERAYAAIAQVARRRQLRLAAALDAIAPPGEAAWDPLNATIELRGQEFHAELLGTFDGGRWVWSWADLGLLIPDESTTYARAARDAAVRLGIAAFATACILDDDERLPAMMGSLACAHGFGEAFWIASDAQVFVFAPDQLDLSSPTRLATVYCARRYSLKEILAHLRREQHLLHAPFEVFEREGLLRLRGKDYEVRIRRIDNLRDVMAEAKRMPAGDEAPRATEMVIVVETELGPDYAELAFGTLAGVWSPTQMAGRAEIPWQALAAAEQLNRLPEVGVYDSYLATWYAR